MNQPDLKSVLWHTLKAATQGAFRELPADEAVLEDGEADLVRGGTAPRTLLVASRGPRINPVARHDLISAYPEPRPPTYPHPYQEVEPGPDFTEAIPTPPPPPAPPWNESGPPEPDPPINPFPPDPEGFPIQFPSGGGIFDFGR